MLTLGIPGAHHCDLNLTHTSIQVTVAPSQWQSHLGSRGAECSLNETCKNWEEGKIGKEKEENQEGSFTPSHPIMFLLCIGSIEYK